MEQSRFPSAGQSPGRSLSRRGFSRALTAGSLGALVLTAKPVIVPAKRKTARKRTKREQDPNRLCRRQGGRCQAFIAEKCLEPDDPLCQEFVACCSRLESCQLTDFVACLEEHGFEFPQFEQP